MPGQKVLQAHLLAQMRSTDLVEIAYTDLGIGYEERLSLRKEAMDLGLTQAGHEMSLYTTLLGQPLDQTTRSHDDPYQRRVDRYLLPPWNGFSFCVQGSTEGVTSSVFFGTLPGAANPRRVSTENLAPWAVVAEELEDYLRTCTVADEWYPMKDYLCGPGHGDRLQVILQFDFSLLQRVVVKGEQSPETG